MSVVITITAVVMAALLFLCILMTFACFKVFSEADDHASEYAETNFCHTAEK